MATAVTRTKVILPRRRPDLLTRQRLLDLLYNLLDYRLVILAAPAGYGKTSLLIDFAHQADLPVCWYSLDLLDRDPQRFIAHFIAAIAQHFPAFGRQSAAALETAQQAGTDVDQLVTTIVNDAYEHIQEHFLLVLDDYHLVNDHREIEEFINRFIQDVDENCHVVLSSRTLMTLPDMPLMVARSLVGGLSFEELAFRAEEIQTLVLQNYHVTMPEKAAEELVQETEGWITGLLLSAQTMWQGMADRLRVARVSGVGLYDYLAQQVLDQQPPAVRDFLLRTSLLEEFDSEMCTAVFGDSQDWSSLIDTLLQNNLFILPVGDDGRWIRYHHLFRDFLQACLEQEAPEAKNLILRQVAVVHSERGDWEKAYAILQRLNDLAASAALIEMAGSALLKNGRLVTLAGWIDNLPNEVLAARPALLSLRGAVAVMQGQVEHGIALLNQAESTQRAGDDYPGLARTLARRAVAQCFLGKYQVSLEDADQALLLAEQSANLGSVQAEALRASGVCLYQLGQLNAATERLMQSLKFYNQLEDRQNIAMVLMEMGMVDMSAGRYRKALAHYKQALNYWRETNNLFRQATLLNNLGVLHHLVGEYERAARYFEEALSSSRQNGFTRMEAYLTCSIGDLYSDVDAHQAAIDAYNQCQGIARQMNDRFLLLYLALAEAALARRSADYIRAGNLIMSAGQLANQSGSRYESGLWQLEMGRQSLATAHSLQAVDNFKSAARCFEEGEQHVEAARAYLHLARAYHAAGDLPAAQIELERSFHIAAGMESQHILVVAGRQSKPVLEALREHPGIGQAVENLLRQVIDFETNIPALRRRLRPHTRTIPFAPPKLTIQTFGRSQVELDGKPVNAPEWQNQRRAREFFYCLLTHPDGMTKEEIGVIFWPDSSPAQLKLQFKNTVYRLRHALGPDVILFDEDRYWFNRSLDYEYDVETFLAKMDFAQSTNNPIEKCQAYRAAANLYKGSYLPEIDGTWVWPERERLWRLYVKAVLELARQHLDAGEYDHTLEYSQQILKDDPCLEEAHRLAMRAYAATGNRAAVSRQYERCRLALLREVSAQPSSQTKFLYEQLKG